MSFEDDITCRECVDAEQGAGSNGGIAGGSEFISSSVVIDFRRRASAFRSAAGSRRIVFERVPADEWPNVTTQNAAQPFLKSDASDCQSGAGFVALRAR
jgi:hypothetical protein